MGPQQRMHAVPVSGEPHHRLRMSNDIMRVYYVEMEPGESTLLHSHEHPYATLVIDDSEIENVAADGSDCEENYDAGEVFVAPAGSVHTITNLAELPFRNYTIALLREHTVAKPSSLMRLERDHQANILVRAPHANIAQARLGPGEEIVLIGDMLTVLMNSAEVEVYSVEGDQVLHDAEQFVFTTGITKLKSRSDAALTSLEIV